MSLEEFRKQIDQADDALIKAFCQRMKIAADIAAFKKEHHLPILDSGRERKKLKAVAEKAGEEMEDYATVLYALLFELSRAYQGHLLDEATELTRADHPGHRGNAPPLPAQGPGGLPGRRGSQLPNRL